MKGIDILCASTAISMDPISSSSMEVGGRGIDRHNPMIRDGRRGLPNPPCPSPHPPINPKPQKSSSKKKSCDTKPNVDKKKIASRRSFVSDLFTPPGSARYLLSDAPFFDGFSDYDPPNNKVKNTQALGNQDHSSVSPQSSHQVRLVQEVVVLRVSLHCKGCEGKVRKHLSRMKGVTSFHIDYAAKKVTVTGDVTPASVLARVSKVKAAQFWTVPSTKSETKKYN